MRDADERETPIRPRPQEQLLIDLLPEFPAARILCTSLGLAQFARTAAEQSASARVCCLYLDLYQAELARQTITAAALPNLNIACAPDFPADEVDLVALPGSAHGEAELTRDLLQTGHERLALGGTLLTSTDNRTDRWLGEQMQALFERVERRSMEHGTVYVGVKRETLRKRKNFACEFVFRDGARLIRAYSRPGVFAHRRVDAGARQLLAHMQIAPGARVLEIGCGSGAASLAAALRAEGVAVHAVDSHARAVECTATGARLNGLASVSTELNATGIYVGRGTYDLALANPPYYAAFQIARRFVLAGREALRPQGRILVVTKSPEWYLEQMPQWFSDVQAIPSREYHLIQGTRA